MNNNEKNNHNEHGNILHHKLIVNKPMKLRVAKMLIRLAVIGSAFSVCPRPLGGDIASSSH